MKTPAIVLSSHVIGLGVIRALGLNQVPLVVVYYEKHDMGYVSKYVKESIYAPHPEKNEQQFVNLLIDIASRYCGSLLIPADDPTLLIVSKNKILLQDYFIVACPEWQITEQFIDKKHTYVLAEKIGVPAPRTIVPKSLKELKRYAKNVLYPCLIKPCLSHRYMALFKIKMTSVNDLDEMIFAYRQAQEQGVEVMIQELIPGDDTHGVNYNSYFWNGVPLVEFTSEKVRLSPPNFGVPRVVQSKPISEIIEPGRKIVKAMGFYGYSCTEFKRDIRDGVYKLMEINGRHNRSGLLATYCGINFPWIEYEHLVNGKLPRPSSYKNGIYWIDEFKDIINNFQYNKQEKYSMGQYLNPYHNRHIYAIFDWRDPRPFIKRITDAVKMGIR